MSACTTYSVSTIGSQCQHNQLRVLASTTYGVSVRGVELEEGDAEGLVFVQCQGDVSVQEARGIGIARDNHTDDSGGAHRVIIRAVRYQANL